MNRCDYLIAGGGIAGSVLALTLLKKGRRVVLVDQPSLSSSSRIAAGAWNPFNFRKFTDNWRAEELVTAAQAFYTEAEVALGAKFYTPREVYKVFTTPDERRLWEKACAETPQKFAGEILENPFSAAVSAPHGIGVVHGAGSIDTRAFLSAAAQHLHTHGDFVEETFAHEKLLFTPEGAEYDHRISARNVVFCEGHLARQNPWFGFLPLLPVKGQVLHVRIPGLPLTQIMNRGAYLLPLGEKRFIAGSTFENHLADENPTPDRAAELLDKLQKFITLPIHVEAHFAGVRPAVKDRRPLLGRHPEHPQLSVFNGMGSKAVLLTPWLAMRMADHLEHGAELPPDVDFRRFTKE